jgi:transcriptional regulator with XRE-family HTH domain
MAERLVEKVGQRVRQLRSEKGWTQSELAAACGLQQSYIGQIERGEKNITISTLERLLDALGVSCTVFFGNHPVACEDEILCEIKKLTTEDRTKVMEFVALLIKWKNRYQND